MYYVLVASPMELEVSTKTPYFDQTIVLDGSLGEALGRLMHALAVRKLAAASAEERQAMRVLLWSFNAREFLQAWRLPLVALKIHKHFHLIEPTM